MSERYVFPGTTPFIEEAAEELNVVVQPHEVQKIQAIKTIAVLCSQVGEHPDPKLLLDHAAEHAAVLKVADLAITKLLDVVRKACGIEPVAKSKAELKAEADAKAAADAKAKAEADAKAKADAAKPAP